MYVQDYTGAGTGYAGENDPPEDVPTCDVCGEPQHDRWDGEDWNGDTGCHRSCEDAVRRVEV